MNTFVEVRNPLVVLLAISFALGGFLAPARAAGSHVAAPSLAFMRSNNVWVASADGSDAHQITRDGTGNGIVNGRQITYAYLSWSPDGRRLVVGRFMSENLLGRPYHQGWSLGTWSPGGSGFVQLTSSTNGADFSPWWSTDSRSIAYMSASRYDNKTTIFHNTLQSTTVSGHLTTLAHFDAREGCLDTSTDPSELTFWNFVGPGGVRQTFIWSSDRKFLVYSTECIHTGLAYQNLATGQSHSIGRWMIEAAIAPNNKRVIGVVSHTLVLSNPDGTGRRVFSGATGARVPVWSPNGRYVYYMARTTLHTLKYRDRDGNLFEIGVNRASIRRLDTTSGTVTALTTLPVHAFSNLQVSPDGRWLYCTRVTNSDVLYEHLKSSPHVTASLLARFGPRSDVVRIGTDTGGLQVIARNAGDAAVRGGPEA